MTMFAEQLKSLRTARNLSQDHLAEQLYISRQAISKWENGDAAPDMDNLIKLAAILEASLDELVLAKAPEVKVERIVETREKHQMNAWEFLAAYWWLLFPIGGFLSWLLPELLPKIFG
ncbi:helix-turn-helix transcriptional regulator [Streptococcus sp. ZJ151]|uniref:helix-turn-helix domain-containing protein n=1 Tax=Streptococcus jiangjianxini TaxID=3161189 RepID=UPI0032F00E32